MRSVTSILRLAAGAAALAGALAAVTPASAGPVSSDRAAAGQRNSASQRGPHLCVHPATAELIECAI